MKKRLLACLFLIVAIGVTTFASPPTPALAVTESPIEFMIATPYTANVGTTSLAAKNCFQVGNNTGDTADWIQATAQPCDYNITMYTPMANQRLKLVPFGTTGYFSISIVFSGKCLGVANGSNADNAIIIQQSCATLSSQHWTVEPNSAGNVLLRGRQSGRCLTSTFSGLVQTAAACTSSGWELIPYGMYKRIQSDWSFKCLDISQASLNEGAKVQQWQCLEANQTNQRFHLKLIDVYTPSGSTGRARYQVLPSHSLKCIAPNAMDSTWQNWTKVLQYTCSFQLGYYWTIRPKYSVNGVLKFEFRTWNNSSFCMDVDLTGGNNNGNEVHLWSCLGTNNQSWIIKDIN